MFLEEVPGHHANIEGLEKTLGEKAPVLNDADRLSKDAQHALRGTAQAASSARRRLDEDEGSGISYTGVARIDGTENASAAAAGARARRENAATIALARSSKPRVDAAARLHKFDAVRTNLARISRDSQPDSRNTRDPQHQSRNPRVPVIPVDSSRNPRETPVKACTN